MPVEGPAEVFCDNKSFVRNLSIPTSVLNKIYNFICYYRVKKDQASGVLRLGCIPREFNFEDLFTKKKVPGIIRHNLVE